MPEKTALARFIKLERRRRGISQLICANECDISAKMLSLIECERANPTLNIMQKFAIYSNVSVSEMLNIGDSGNMHLVNNDIFHMMAACHIGKTVFFGIAAINKREIILRFNAESIFNFNDLCSRASGNSEQLHVIIDF